MAGNFQPIPRSCVGTAASPAGYCRGRIDGRRSATAQSTEWSQHCCPEAATLAWQPIPDYNGPYLVRVDDPNWDGAQAPGFTHDCAIHYLCVTTSQHELTVPVQPGAEYSWWVHTPGRDAAISSFSTPEVQSEPLVDDGLVGAWQMDSPSGSQVLDASGQGNDGQVVGSPVAISGPVGQALYLHGDGDRVLIADDASLAVQSLTIAAWLQPQERSTQYAISKATKNGEDGFELSLSSRGPVFVRFNQDSSGNDYRVESNRTYPTDGTTWLHVVATYDGSTIKLYLDGQLEASQAASFSLATNQLALSLGAQHDGTRPFLGGMDDVRIYNRALDAQEIAAVIAGQPITPPDDPPPPPDDPPPPADPPPPPADPPPPDDPVNQAPSVIAGADQTTLVNQSLPLAAVVDDDGLPNGSLTFAWSVASGPGAAVWQDNTSATTTVSFVEPGNYVLRMTADDGQLTSFDELTVQVQSEPLVDDGLVAPGRWTRPAVRRCWMLQARAMTAKWSAVRWPSVVPLVRRCTCTVTATEC